MHVLAVSAKSLLSAGAGGSSASPASAGSLAGQGPATIALELATASIPEDWRHEEPAILLRGQVVHGFSCGSNQLGIPTANFPEQVVVFQLIYLLAFIMVGPESRVELSIKWW